MCKIIFTAAASWPQCSALWPMWHSAVVIIISFLMTLVSLVRFQRIADQGGTIQVLAQYWFPPNYHHHHTCLSPKEILKVCAKKNMFHCCQSTLLSEHPTPPPTTIDDASPPEKAQKDLMTKFVTGRGRDGGGVSWHMLHYFLTLFLNKMAPKVLLGKWVMDGYKV